MLRRPHALPILATAIALLVVSLHGQQPPAPARPGGDEQGFRFKSGVELINVTATVSDASGRFVSGLRQDDFVVYEDDQPVGVTHFSAEHVAVSLGIALDTSGSMAGSKIQEAQDALDRFLYDLLDKNDEIFLYRFSNYPVLLQDWTKDRQLLSRALGRIRRTAAPRCTTQSPRRFRWRKRVRTARRRCSWFRTGTTRQAPGAFARSRRRFARVRCWCTRSASMARANRRCGRRRRSGPCRSRFPFREAAAGAEDVRAGRSRRSAAVVAVAGQEEADGRGRAATTIA